MPVLFEFDAEGSALNSTSSDYNIQEDLFAGYAMFSVDVGKATVLGGVRVEYTDATYDALLVEEPRP